MLAYRSDLDLNGMCLAIFYFRQAVHREGPGWRQALVQGACCSVLRFFTGGLLICAVKQSQITQACNCCRIFLEGFLSRVETCMHRPLFADMAMREILRIWKSRLPWILAELLTLVLQGTDKELKTAINSFTVL